MTTYNEYVGIYLPKGLLLNKVPYEQIYCHLKDYK